MDGFAASRRLITMLGDGLRWLTAAKRRAWAACDELLRSFLMVFVLQPVAILLPRKSALGIARICGSVMLRVPPSGPSALKTMQKALLMEEAAARTAASEYLAQPFYSFVVFHRVLHGRENPNNWTIEERKSEAVAQLRESGRPFIVATGHFRRESFLALHMPRFSPGNVATVLVEVPARSLRPQKIRLRIQFGQLLRALRHSRPDEKFVYVGGAFEKLLAHLKQPRGQVIISIDAFWKTTGSSAHTRSFAGMRARPFSIGAAALSRLTQCPIVACASYVGKDETIVLEWGPVIPPPKREDEAADFRTTNAMLDFIEDSIGQRPTQYVLYIGDQRRRSPDLQGWENTGGNGDQLSD